MTKGGDAKESGKQTEKLAASKNQSNKKQKNYKGKNHLTASQLRNARKRRAKAAAAKTTTTTTARSGSRASSSSYSHQSQQQRRQQQQQQQQQQADTIDPSLRYISNPCQAPIVQRAIRFFTQQHQPAYNSQFPVILSSETALYNKNDDSQASPRNGKQEKLPTAAATVAVGWRTVAKLAVRSNSADDDDDERNITIGLFAPGSHDVLDATTCPAHHPSINRAVQCLQEICRQRHNENGVTVDSSRDSSSSSGQPDINTTTTTIAIPAYSEQSGQGCFRYVQCQVERVTGAVQITLVWRKDPQHDAALKYLCQQIIAISSSSSSSGAAGVGAGSTPFLLHSLWIHYNNAGKHENSIVSRSATVNTMECRSLDELDTLGQDGSWVHVIMPVAPSSAVASSHNNDTNDNMTTMDCSLLSSGGGIVVERLDSVLRQGDSDNDGSDEDNDDDRARSRKRQLLSVPLHFAPNVFRQANLDGFGAIVAKIRSYFKAHLKKQQQRQQSINLVELYGGVGTIGLHLADLCTSLVCSDENPYNQSCFQAAVNGMQWSSSSNSSSKKKKKHKKQRKQNKEEQCQNDNNNHVDAAPTMIRYEPKSATAMVQNVSLVRDADWIIVDPPRKGLDEAVIQALCLNQHGQQLQHQQVLVYVSCGFDAFQRDFGQLTTMGKPWSLQSAEGHILFPGSDAIEVLAFFTR